MYTLVKVERGPMSLRSLQFVRTVKFLTVREEEFTVRKLHVISDTWKIFGFAGNIVEGSNVVTVRTVRAVCKVLNGP